jgi:signal transduction histidine kinase
LPYFLATAELNPLIQEKGHQLSFVRAGAVPPVVVDPQLIRQVILNLASNAVKYTPPGGDIAITVRRAGASVCWAVRNSGIGIPKDAQRRLFEKFSRAENVFVVETEGTGLGVYIVRLIVEQFGGRVWCHSDEGKGATFFFSLPLPE